MANALIFAARDGMVSEVRVRLEAEASLATYADSHGQTALMWAAVQGHTDVARVLLDSGSALNGTEWEMGRTALYMAAGRGHVSFVELLLQRGADPSIRRAGGRTPLGIAAYNGHTEVVKLLLAYANCDLDGRDDQGCTPLWQAARNGRAPALRLLLAAGADTTIAGEQGWSALDVAREKDRAECVALLEGEERAYLLSKARRLWREERVLQAAIKEGRILEPEEVPVHLIGRLLHCTSQDSGSSSPTTTSSTLSGDSCPGTPRVGSEEEDETMNALMTKQTRPAREDATAAAQYVIEGMRFDVFLQLRELLALSSNNCI